MDGIQKKISGIFKNFTQTLWIILVVSYVIVIVCLLCIIGWLLLAIIDIVLGLGLSFG